MMFEFGLLFAGVFALPWYILAILVIVFLCDVGAASKDEFAFASCAILAGVVLVSGLGWWTEGFNPISWAWNNPVDMITGFVIYALTGCLWAIAKWWLFLKKSHKQAEIDHEKTMTLFRHDLKNGFAQASDEPKRQRPRESFATSNVGRLTGWIFHWPFSMVGVIIGDFILRFADILYKALQGLFERMAAARFQGYEK
jgi:hypothetical protein